MPAGLVFKNHQGYGNKTRTEAGAHEGSMTQTSEHSITKHSNVDDPHGATRVHLGSMLESSLAASYRNGEACLAMNTDNNQVILPNRPPK